ncbi:hypothetical protein J2M53_06985 [Arthrobacter sp. zg-ZUI100]|uniref:hypothetical protein n=1 Tax=Arthrobacter jiangjiafuii TaxID=2817475 RepID=UPI001AEE482C|nr:hypothetical protein [Arthrobacter jiangjiafuii]MBP3035996.1 hypothetical protein [Arthrobacter jiangjiafuii]
MKSAKLAVLALLAASLTAGPIPAYGYSEVPAPVPAVDPTGDAGIMTAPPSPDAVPGVDAVAPVPEDPATAEPAPVTTPADVPTEPAVGHGEMHTDETEADEAGEDLGYDPVVGGGFPVPGPNTPMVTDPDGTVRSAVETDISAAHDHEPQTFSTRDGGASTAGAAARSATLRVTLVFATLTDNRGGVDQTAARNSITEANKYWRAMSNGRLGMDIVETRSINSTANSGQDYAAMMNTIRKDLNWYEDPDEALVVFVPAADLRSGGYGGILGGGWTSGPTSGSVIMPRPSSFTNNVVTHELGHVLGLLHANSLKCNNGRSDVWVSNGRWGDNECTSREYGDTSDLMGYAQYNLPVINSYFWDSGAFGRGDEIVNAGTPSRSHTYTLRAWAGSASQRAVKFRDNSGETYYVELRLPVGYDAGTAVGGNRGVKIVKADLANSWALNSVVIAPNTRDFSGYTNANSTWQAGQTFTTHAGMKVKINSISGDSASVTIGPSPSIPSPADLVAIDPTGNLMHYGANGNGTFGGAIRIGTGWSGAISAHSTDWNGDGTLDILSQTRDGYLFIYYGYASGGFSGPVTIGQGWQQLRITVGKWGAGDSLPGIVAVDARDRVWSYRNTSGGYLSPGSTIATGIGPRLFSVADFNKDGVPELITIMHDGTLVSRARTSAGMAGAGTQIGEGWQNAASLSSSVDFSGAGSRGLLVTFDDGRLAYYNSNGRGGWTGSWNVGSGWNGYLPLNTQRATGSGPSGTSEADIVTLSGSGYLHRYPAKSHGVLGAAEIIGEGFHRVQSFHNVDWNQDGVSDVLVQWEEGSLTVYYGSPSGGLVSPRTVGSNWQDLTISVDRPTRGLPGILATDRNGNLRRYTNPDGASVLRGGGIVGVGWSNLRIQVLDWDGDGTSDVIAANPRGEMIFYRRNASATFIQEAKTIGSGWDSLNSISVGTDIAGNGQSSIVARSKNGDLLNYPVPGVGQWGSVQKLGWGWDNLRISGSR